MSPFCRQLDRLAAFDKGGDDIWCEEEGKA